MITLLIAQSSFDLANVGDIAMLQVALARFHQLWPGCRCRVLARNATGLAALAPEADLVPSDGLMAWGRPLSGRAARQLPYALSEAAELAVRYRLPALGVWAAQHKARRTPGVRHDIQALHRAMDEADLVVATGGGYLTDTFPGVCRSMLRLLEGAQRRKRPTYLFGQGIGPLHEADLRRLAARVLPQVDMIALREAQSSLPLLHELGVPQDHIVVTGDDAIEPAYNAHTRALGDAVGVNLRVDRCAAMTPAHVDAISAAARRLADELHAPLHPLPISIASNDQAVIAQALLLDGATAGQAPLTAPAAIAAVGRCRIVVTCSYHAGVFALAQGIPAVCIASSAYYRAKFRGLEAQFGEGCMMLDVDSAGFGDRLAEALFISWQRAGAVREALLAAARSQIAASRQAYQHAAELAVVREGRR